MFVDGLKDFKQEWKELRMNTKCKALSTLQQCCWRFKSSGILCQVTSNCIFQRNTVPSFWGSSGPRAIYPLTWHNILFLCQKIKFMEKLTIIAYSHFLGLEGEWQFADRKETFVQHMVLQSCHCNFLCTPVNDICCNIQHLVPWEFWMNINLFWDVTAWYHISGDSNLYQHCCDNHKSHSFSLLRAENFNLRIPFWTC